VGWLGEGQFAKVQAEYVVVEEGEGGVGCFQAAQRLLFGLGDVLQEAAEVAEVAVARMAFVVEQNQAACPVGAVFSRSIVAEACLRHLADEVEETRGGRSSRGGKRRGGHGMPPESGTGLVEGECTYEQKAGQEKKQVGSELCLTDGVRGRVMSGGVRDRF
jgi:hypothetical protein